MFLHELAMELGMSVQQLTTGRPGMPLSELTRDWPLFFKYQQRAADREEEKRKERSRHV